MSQHQLPQTGGPIDRVVCPNCGKTNDFRELHSQQLMDTGSGVICDHCQRKMIIAAIRQVMFVAVTPVQPTNALPPAQPRRYLKK